MLYAVIPAGGSGTRLWPLSRADHPKFLHPLTGSAASLLQATVERLEPLAPAERTYVVTGRSHATAVARQLPHLPDGNILIEPSARDSCAAIGLAAAVIARRDPRAVMGAFPADHLVRDREAFVSTVREAITGAERGLLMTVGITPTRPETGFGYLRRGAGSGSVRPVEEFTEKPAYDLAVSYVDSGRYLWNAGMFVWRVDVFLGELARQQPVLHAGLERIAAAWDTDEQDDVLDEVWPTLPRISVDYAVMEGAAGASLVGTVPGDFGWSDVGDFHTLAEALPADAAGNVVVGAVADDKAEVILRDSTGTVVVPLSGRLVAALGVSDLVVVDTPDALLICPRSRAQDVKQLVDELRELGETAYV